MNFLNQSIAPLLCALMCLFSSHIQAQCSSIIDLNTWSQEGPAANGNWAVNAAGTSVTQSINGYPTFFVSPQSFINVRITGTIVTTGNDDDFIGFVFGYRNPIGQTANPMPVDTWLFDWKRGNQTVGTSNIDEGQYLSEVIGNFNLSVHDANFWGHQPGNGFNTVASNTGAGTGWAVGTTYNFELTYLSDRTVIVMNNDTFFDFSGCFEPGKFGFYNYSQNPVVYSNFAYTLLPEFTMASTNVCLNDSAGFSYSADTCSSASVTYSVISNWEWDFGDGNTSNLTNPNHLYSTPGNYNVELIITDSFGCQDSLTQAIVVSPVPPPPLLSNNSPICEGDSLHLTGTASGTGLTFNWTGPNGYTSTQQNPSLAPTTVAMGGAYIASVFDGNCYSDPDSTITVVNPTPSAPVVGSNSPVCEDSLLSLTATSSVGATYNWSGPNAFTSTSQNPTLAAPTTVASGGYTVFATLGTCQGPPNTVNVTINPTPILTISGDTSICIGDATTLTAAGASTYQWNLGPATADQTVSPLVDTYFSVTGNSLAGCPSLPDSILVTVHPLPVVFLGNDTTVCDSLILDAGPGFADYDWNTTATTPTLIVNTTGTYFVTVMTADSCFASDTINVTITPTPSPVITGSSPICLGDNAPLTASPGSNFQWSTGATTASISVAPTSDSIFTVTATNNGCVSEPDSFLVVVNPLPVVNLGADTVVCDQMTLDAGPGQSAYAWNGGATTQVLPVSISGTYQVTVTDANSCQASDTILVTVNNTIPVDLGPDQSVCPGTTTPLNASPPGFASYLWSTTATTPSISAGLGTYSIAVMDANGCPSVDTVVVNEFALLTGNLGNDTLICDGNSLVLDATSWGAASHVWNPGGAGPSAISISNPGLYIVTMDDGNGCLYRDSLDVTVDVPPTMVLSQSVTDACQGDPVLYTVVPGGMATYQFLLNGTPVQTGSSNTFSSTSLQDGDIISVLATTLAGCPALPSNAVDIGILPRPSGSVSATAVCEGFVTDLTVLPSPGSTINWSGIDGLTGTGPAITHTYSGPGSFGYTVVLDNGLCQTNLSGSALVYPEPSATIAPDRTICEGEDITLVSSGGGNIEWYDSPVGGNQVDAGNEFLILNASNSDTFYVQQVSAVGCIGPRIPVVLTVNPNPTADFISQPDTATEINIPQSEVTFVNMSSLADFSAWNFGDGGSSTENSPVYTFQEEGIYLVTLVVSTVEGCQDTIVRGPYNVIDLHNVFIPNAFSPDGDNLNDVFEVVTFGIAEFDLDVYDRWGKLIFTNAGNMDLGWNGTFQGQPLPEGAYVYKVIARKTDGSQSMYQGTVTLLR